MKSFQDEILWMKIKNVLNGFKEWREGIVERIFLNEIFFFIFKFVGGGDFYIKRMVGWGCCCIFQELKKRELGGFFGVYVDCVFIFNIIL